MAGRGSKPGERRGGRAKGTPNRVNKDARLAFVKFLNNNADRAQALWRKVAKKDPARALEILGKLGEFVVPKLARTEHSGPGGGPITTASVSTQVNDEDAMKSYLKLISGGN